MKIFILAAGAIMACSGAFSQQTEWHVPTGKELITYKHPKNKIYQKGWIDYNKNGRKDVYEDPEANIEDRINDLLSQMTVEEKTCQMVTLYGYRRILKDALPTPEWKNKLWKDGVGAIDEQLNGFPYRDSDKSPYIWPASRHAWALNEIQRFFIEETRLGIPVDFTNEGLRGVESWKATNFPTQLGLGHTWNRELIRKVGYITGSEARLLGYTNVYAPILDVARDQRWGRNEEVYGESPYLIAELGVNMVRGMQQDYQIAATAKHFLGQGANRGARDGAARTDPQVTPRELEYLHAYPFERVIKEAGLLGIMSAYNDYDGVPVTGSDYWLETRLRGQMGFKGYVVSDSEALEYLATKHHVASDIKDAVREGVIAGLDVRCTFRTPESYVEPLRELIKEGKIPMDTIDNRVRSILRVKFMVGIFDHPYQTDLQKADTYVNCEENQKVAMQASRECLVLLKNENNLLPLDASKLGRIAVVGPNADESRYALLHYGPVGVDVTSVLGGIKQRVGDTVKVVYTKGCDLVDANWPESELFPSPLTDEERSGIDEAVENVKQSDVAIVVLGGGERTCGESRSRSSIDLPGRQLDLLQAVYATGKPVVLVLINGRPLSINWADRYVPAILEAWYPGSKGGTAVSEAIFGDYNPGGKLTVTFPKSVGQLPFNFPHKPAAQADGGKKLGLKGDASRANGAIYDFGHGLSYTTFEYSDLKLSADKIRPDGKLTVSCTIKNTGRRAGDEVAQLYLRDELSTVTTYEKVLRGFERIHLAPGEAKEVSFELLPRDMELINRNLQRVVEPGKFKVMVGTSSTDIKLNGEFEVTE